LALEEVQGHQVRPVVLEILEAPPGQRVAHTAAAQCLTVQAALAQYASFGPERSANSHQQEQQTNKENPCG
jgi:hypothetical protein